MSFESLKLAELRQVVDSFGVDLPAKPTKKAIIAALEDEGVTWDQYERFIDADKQETQAEPFARKPDLTVQNTETILVKMERSNFSYQIGNLTFTKEHPFMVLPVDVANEVFTHPGFRPATPLEVQQFYG